MNLKDVFNKYWKFVLVSFVVSVIVSLPFLKTIGKKDLIIVFAATFLLCNSLLLLKGDVKKSILLFILSFPIIVTARKICYFNFFIFKITYETIYITAAFLFNIKQIWINLKRVFKYDENKHNKNFLIYVAMFVFLAVNSCMFSNDVFRSMSSVYISIVVPCMLMILIVSIFDKKDVYDIYYMLIAGADFSCLYGFMQIVTNKIPLKRINYSREFLTFGYHNTNLFAVVITLILPLLLQAIFYKKNTKKEKIFLYGSFILFTSAIIISFTRGAWICFLISLLVIFFSKKYRYIVYGECFVVLLFSKKILGFIISRGTTSTSFLQSESTVARIQSFFTSLKIMSIYPFGIGGDNFKAMYAKYSDAGYLMMPEKFRWTVRVANYALESAHNLWLQIGVEYGFIAMLIFLLLILNRLIDIFKNYSLNRGAFAALVSFIILSVLTGTEFNHKGVLTGTLIFWIVFAITFINNKKEG